MGFNPIERFYTLVKNKSTVPRWTIFILDLLICNFALVFAFLLRFNFDFDSVQQHGYVLQLIFVTGLNSIFFRVFHTYEGLIRLSGAQEGWRCVSAVFWTTFVLLVSIAFSAVVDLRYLVPTSVLIIYFFTASFLIFAYRIWIKIIYKKSIKGKVAADNVLIFGSTINGAFLKNAIESILDKHYNVIGFIEDDQNLKGKSIDNVKFYSFEELRRVTGKYKVRTIFMTADDPDVVMKNKIVDYCLVNNITVKVIPEFQKWTHGHLHKRQIKNLKIEDLLSRPDIKLPSKPIKEFLAGKRILITGAAGSIGSELVKQLISVNAESLILCDNRETGLYDLQYQLQQLSTEESNIIVRVSDVRDKKVMQDLFETHKPQIVFHAAAYKHVPLMETHPCEAVNNNVHGTKIVADLSVLFSVELFIFISTDKAINPTNIMGASKRIAEMYLGELQSGQYQVKRVHSRTGSRVNTKNLGEAQRGTKFIITRFGNVLGSNGSVIPHFQRQIDKGGPVTVTHPDIIRYFMTIPEACSLVLEACRMGKGGEIFVFDMGEPVKIVDLANKMIRLSGLVVGRDISIEFTGLRPGEKLFEEILNKDEEVIKTHHKKIMISRGQINAFQNIVKNVDHLIEISSRNEKLLLVKQMKIIVPEFKSKNSPYEILDPDENTGFSYTANTGESHINDRQLQ